jgi:hypothetical protein
MPHPSSFRRPVLLLALAGVACATRDKTATSDASNIPTLPKGAEVEAVSLMRSVEQQYASLKTLKVERRGWKKELYLRRDSLKSVGKSTMWLARPNMFRVESHATWGGGTVGAKMFSRTDSQLRMSDGQSMHLVGVMGPCLKLPAPTMTGRSSEESNDPQIGWFYGLRDHLMGVLVRDYWNSEMRLMSPQFRTLRIVGTDTLNGEPHTVVEWTYYVDYSMPDDDNLHTTKFYIGKDRLIHKIVTRTPRYEGEETFKLTADEEIRAEKFTSVVKDVKCTTPPPIEEQWAKLDTIYRYLKVGAQAPDFALNDAVTGKEFTLKQLLAGKKALILDFLSYG